MATTSNFGWTTPDDTDLVKDGALAIRTLGNNIDTSLVDLKGGTTGQILSKNSNSDLDYTWINNDQGDITEVVAGTGLSGGGTSGSVTLTNTVATEFDAKGDLVVGTGADTFDKLTAGANGESLLADSTTTTGLRWQADWNTGKNKIINGDFAINQRGFTSTTSTLTYGFDRFYLQRGTGGTVTYSTQAFTPGTAPVAGYEGINFARLVTASQTGTNDYSVLRQKIEDVRTLSGQTVTVSAWLKAGTNGHLANFEISQDFGSGGSSAVTVKGANISLTTSWARYSTTFTVGSMSGKTIGTASAMIASVWTSAGSGLSAFSDIGNQNATIDIWGLQVEAGSVATPFTTATGTLAGELAACQRYYWRNATGVAYGAQGQGAANSTTVAIIQVKNPVRMRVAPTSIDSSGNEISDFGGTATALTALAIRSNESNQDITVVDATVASGLTQHRPYYLRASNNTGAFFGANAEL